MLRSLKLLVFIAFFACTAQVQAQDYLFFTDSDIPNYYDPSYLQVTSPSELLTVNSVKFPVVADTFYAGINGLKLQYRSMTGGDWVAAVAAPGWPGRDATLKDSIVFMVYSKVAVSAADLPKIFVEDLSNQRSTKIPLSLYNPQGIPAGQWTLLWAPLDTFKRNPGGCDLTRIKTIFFGQSVADGVQQTLFLDNIKMTGGASIYDYNYIVVLGSSTSAGTGANPPDSAYVNRVRAHIAGVDTTYKVLNLAVGGFTSYHVMPTGFVPPGGRPTPRATNNITYALEYNPKAIFINLPSNDAASSYPMSEQIANYDTLVAVANRRNVKLWITTTQPRNLSTQAQLDLLTGMRDSVFTRYAPYAVDFWTTLAQPNGFIVPEFNSGDGIHLNNAGHRLLYQRAIEVILPILVPVELVSFIGTRTGNDVVLQWITGTEANNYGFEVQRSADKTGFETIGFVEGSGTTASPTSYSFTDGTAQKEQTWYYRLKQIDYDGTSSYSGLAEVEAELPVGFFLFQNYPNPFNPVTTVSFTLPNAMNADMKLYDITGKEVATIFSGELPQGYHSLKIDGTKLASGVYTCRLVAGEYSQTIKLSLLK